MRAYASRTLASLALALAIVVTVQAALGIGALMMQVPFAKPTLTAIQSANPTDPGTQPRPTVGIQFVDIPEFTDFGTQASQAISSAIAGKISVANALSQSQSLAQKAGDKYK